MIAESKYKNQDKLFAKCFVKMTHKEQIDYVCISNNGVFMNWTVYMGSEAFNRQIKFKDDMIDKYNKKPGDEPGLSKKELSSL